MHLTPNQRASVVYIYLNLVPSRLMNRAKETSAIAAEQGIIISVSGVKKIVYKWRQTSNY
jgi:hypothetical protein